MRVIWSERSISELSEIWDYVAKDSETYAALILRRIQTAVERLPATPEIGRIGRVVGTRELVVQRTPYIVAYETSRHVISVLSVVHGAREWPKQFSSEK